MQDTSLGVDANMVSQYLTAAQLLKKQDDACLRFAIQGVATPDVTALVSAAAAKHVTLGIPIGAPAKGV